MRMGRNQLIAVDRRIGKLDPFEERPSCTCEGAAAPRKEQLADIKTNTGEQAPAEGIASVFLFLGEATCVVAGVHFEKPERSLLATARSLLV